MKYLLLFAIPFCLCAAWPGIKTAPVPTSETSAIRDTVTELGKKIYATTCNMCHADSLKTLAPGISVLGAMTPRSVLSAMNTGKMKPQAAKLSDLEKRAVVKYITGSAVTETRIYDSFFVTFTPGKTRSPQTDCSGWGNDAEGSGYRNPKQAGITNSNVSTLKPVWAFAFPDGTITRTKPAVAGDWIITGSQYGDIYAINKFTGKPAWHFEAAAAIRGAITIVNSENSVTAYFADFITNTYALNVKTGKVIWNKRAGYESQSSVTGSVIVSGGKVFVPITSVEVGLAANGSYPCCTSSGGLVALDAKTGNKIWVHRVLDAAKESGKKKNGKPYFGPSGAPVWCSPTVDVKRNLVYIGIGENYSLPTSSTSDAVQAIDMNTGKVKWNFQATPNDVYNLSCPVMVNCPEKSGPDLDFGMAPILVHRKTGGDILLAGQKSGEVFALSPLDGKMIWRTRVGKGGKLGGIHWGMATDGNTVYAANADNFIALDMRDTAWKAKPGISAIDISTGNIKWYAPTPPCSGRKGCFPANSAAPLALPGLVLAGALDGHIRAYDSTDGKILWDFDTQSSLETSNGIKGEGGAIDGPAPVASGGMLFVNSGYGMFGQKQGNLLIAFRVDQVVDKK